MKNLILIIGPPSVGKMTVGQELVKMKGYALLHNHHSIELALDLFKHGTEDFNKVNDGIRKLALKTVSESKELEGFIFTLVVAFDLKEDIDYLKSIIDLFESKNWKSHILELNADLETRLKRNVTENRLEHKKSKRDLDFSNTNLVKMEEQYIMNSSGGELSCSKYLKIDNANKSARQVAEEAIEKFEL